MHAKENKSLPARVYVMGGVAVGAVIGAALGLLYAPKKGSELREDLDELGHAARDQSRRMYSRVKEIVPDGIRAANARVKELIG